MSRDAAERWEWAPAEALIEQFDPGSHGDDWTWADEEADLNGRGELDKLADEVVVNGFTEPVLLGNDGRVWDGHHRILVGRMLAMNVPYELGQDECDKCCGRGCLECGDTGRDTTDWAKA